MKPFFSKTFDRWDVGTLDYEKCAGCGFVACASLLRLSDEDWSALNHRFHSTIYDGSDPFNRAGRLAGQARAIDAMLSVGLIDSNKPMLDWGSGVGDLATQLVSRGRTLFSYDQYITPVVNRWPQSQPPRGGFALVTACAVLEHLKDRRELDAIEQLVADRGVLGIHLLIPRAIPKDPSWVYLLPVHCAFHTWESMRLLLQQWSYEATVYCHDALMWFFFKCKDGVESKVEHINRSEGSGYLRYVEGFVSASGVELPLDPDYGAVDRSLRTLYVGIRPEQQDADWLSAVLPFCADTAWGDTPQTAPGSLPPQSFDAIYSDLVAERLTPKQFIRYLEWTRGLLKPGGVHRFATSDLDLTLQSAHSGAWRELPWVKEAGITTRGYFLNTVFRSWGHVYLYDDATLLARLARSGYRHAARSTALRGRCASLYRLDRDTHRLYVEAER
ncbi:hypothetical protein QSH18_17380 [Xanthomonas sp. NCPPB 2654]|uniref:methyltransferase domain-containing protein n=1 Tax=unclassified Xanthomonas TaxID=2643310 RepID=UPI0021E03158|nr:MULTISPECIES: methyltransferase domain-containing protein [unclassified Xanthomonas]MDL5367384.1 hypothetical protein [Xanthomonas sp. NCPPB 2654]UYC19287.1 hypothetical protein NUG20_14000 [Xanthomonas sp. CFBP 8443]